MRIDIINSRLVFAEVIKIDAFIGMRVNICGNGNEGFLFLEGKKDGYFINVATMRLCPDVWLCTHY